MGGVDCDNIMLQDVVSCTNPPSPLLPIIYWVETGLEKPGWAGGPSACTGAGGGELGMRHCPRPPHQVWRCTGTSVDIGLCPWSLVSVFIPP